jgi:NTP pyrophosphatase (non-canonical NTP hydrolase)
MLKLPLKEKPLLVDYQEHIKEFCKINGWDKSSASELFLLFMEEVGELAKAIRNEQKMFQEEAKKNKKFNLEEEFADVFSYLLDLANLFQIDLEKAYRLKHAINEQRTWK